MKLGQAATAVFFLILGFHSNACFMRETESVSVVH